MILGRAHDEWPDPRKDDLPAMDMPGENEWQAGGEIGGDIRRMGQHDRHGPDVACCHQRRGCIVMTREAVSNTDNRERPTPDCLVSRTAIPALFKATRTAPGAVH